MNLFPAIRLNPRNPPRVGKNFFSALPDEFLFDSRNIDKLMRHPIVIEKSGRRQNLAEAIAKCRFAGGNSARDSDRRHVLGYTIGAAEPNQKKSGPCMHTSRSLN